MLTLFIMLPCIISAFRKGESEYEFGILPILSIIADVFIAKYFFQYIGG